MTTIHHAAIEQCHSAFAQKYSHFIHQTPLWKLPGKALGAVSVRKMPGIEETIKFPLPKGLKLDAQGQALDVGDSQLHQIP